MTGTPGLYPSLTLLCRFRIDIVLAGYPVLPSTVRCSKERQPVV
jgi:hypothetical protein